MSARAISTPRALLLFGAILAALILPGSAQANDGASERIVIKGDVVVERGDRSGTVVVVDGRVLIAGTVEDDVVAISAPVVVTGEIEGDLVTVADRATLARGARVGGDVIYVDERPRVSAGASVGGDVRKLEADEFAGPLGLFFSYFAFWLAVSLSTLALGFALLWLAPRAAERASETSRSQFGVSIAWGFGALIGLPILALLAIVTLVGIPLGVALLLAMVPLYAVGYTTGAWLLGRWLVKPPASRALAFLAGWGILRAIALVPVLGALVGCFAAVIGIGALAAAGWAARKGPTAPPASGTPPGTPSAPGGSPAGLAPSAPV